MQIERKLPDNTRSLRTVLIGDVFELYGSLYLVIDDAPRDDESVRCVSLESGVLTAFGGDTNVLPIKGKFVVDEGPDLSLEGIRKVYENFVKSGVSSPKIQTIKWYREQTGSGLGDAKNMVEASLANGISISAVY